MSVVRIKSPLGYDLCEIDPTGCITIEHLLQRVTQKTRAYGAYLRPLFWDENTALDPSINVPSHLKEYVLCTNTNGIVLKKMEDEKEEEIDNDFIGEVVFKIFAAFITLGTILGYLYN